MKIKITDQDKVNHFVNNLTQRVWFGDKSLLNLYSKVKEVQKNPEFKAFCIKMHDSGKVSVETLKLFFNKN